MTVLYTFAEGIMVGLTKLNQADLPLGLVSRVRRVLKNFKEELEIYNPEREKILRETCTLEKDEKTGAQIWKFPEPESEKRSEFEKRWSELHAQKLIFPYEPIDYLKLIDDAPDEVKKKIVAKGSDFDVLEALNDAYDEQFKKDTPPAEITSAGVADKGDSNPPTA